MDDCKRWAVYSPTRESHHSVMGDPPEWGAYYVEIEAPSKRDALIMASKTREMADYAAEMRGDNRPPWYGLTVEGF